MTSDRLHAPDVALTVMQPLHARQDPPLGMSLHRSQPGPAAWPEQRRARSAGCRDIGEATAEAGGTRVKFADQEFRDQRIDLDHNEFRNCVFHNCTAVYRGGNPPTITGCEFHNCKFSFADSAARTLAYLTSMHQRGFREIVEQVLKNVTAGESGTDPATDSVLH
jgi:hypothetical protein